MNRTRCKKEKQKGAQKNVLRRSIIVLRVPFSLGYSYETKYDVENIRASPNSCFWFMCLHQVGS